MPTRLLFLSILVVIISSCEKKVSLQLPVKDSQPVLNLLMNKDSMIMARVSLSNRVNLTDPVLEVKNADVDLYENGTFKEKLLPIVFSGRTWYQGKTLAQTGATYRVTAVVPGYKEVIGSDQMPDTVPIEEMKFTLAQTDATINVQLRDDPAVQNYYRVRLFGISKLWGNNDPRKIQRLFEAEDATLDLFNDKERIEFFTTDALFNGRSPRFVFKVKNIYSDAYVSIEISSLTYNSYNYLYSAFMAEEKNTNALSEKVIVFNNIENGLGIVGGVASREYVLKQ